MDVIVLAAGYGTRLYPLTKSTPKPLLLVRGKTILDHIFSKLSRVSGIKRVFVVSNETFFKNFSIWAKSNEFSFELKIINDGVTSNEERLGAIGDINFVLKKEKIDGPLLVIGGDNLFGFSLEDFVSFAVKKGSTCVALRFFEDKSFLAKKFGVAIIDKNAKIISFEEKPEYPTSNYGSTACYYFPQKVFPFFKKYFEKGCSADNSGDFIKYLIQESEVYGYVFSEQWFDIGSVESLKDAEANYDA
jgi:glucose-1-phosphate thymidylyltransferase